MIKIRSTRTSYKKAYHFQRTTYHTKLQKSKAYYLKLRRVAVKNYNIVRSAVLKAQRSALAKVKKLYTLRLRLALKRKIVAFKAAFAWW